MARPFSALPPPADYQPAKFSKVLPSMTREVKHHNGLALPTVLSTGVAEGRKKYLEKFQELLNLELKSDEEEVELSTNRFRKFAHSCLDPRHAPFLAKGTSDQ